jgi:hypothetical protein
VANVGRCSLVACRRDFVNLDATARGAGTPRSEFITETIRRSFPRDRSMPARRMARSVTDTPSRITDTGKPLRGPRERRTNHHRLRRDGVCGQSPWSAGRLLRPLPVRALGGMTSAGGCPGDGAGPVAAGGMAGLDVARVDWANPAPGSSTTAATAETNRILKRVMSIGTRNQFPESIPRGRPCQPALLKS